MKTRLRFSKEVEEARRESRAIVALESTIISHGMPWPENHQTAMEVENLVREEGAVPATIAVVEGELCVGLEAEQLRFLAEEREVLKLSRRDLPYAVSERKSGATTVAATMIIAEMAGIKIFATGGIGGVHRSFASDLDISADLRELSQTNVAVVCAGVKSILNIPATLERLETLGVPVLGYQTKEFPAFYHPNSGCGVDYKMNDVEELCRFVNTKWGMGLQGGILIANPIPKEDAMDVELVENAIQKALQEADDLAVKGKEITPFLLNAVKVMTQGKSLESNIALIKNNVRLAAKIALKMA